MRSRVESNTERCKKSAQIVSIDTGWIMKSVQQLRSFEIMAVC